MARETEHTSRFSNQHNKGGKMEKKPTILRDKVIVTQTKHEKLPVFPFLPIHRHKRKALPLLIQQTWALRPAITELEPRQCTVDVEVEE